MSIGILSILFYSILNFYSTLFLPRKTKAQHQEHNQKSSFHRHSQVDTTEMPGSFHVKVGKPYQSDTILTFS